MISNGPLSLHGKRKLCGAFLLLAAWAVPVFAGKVLAEVEYFYADDGTLTGRAVNGKRMNFEYDLRGQLLAVKDAQGRDLERYTYDPAGNRLSKTVGSVTTTYVYDEDRNYFVDPISNIIDGFANYVSSVFSSAYHSLTPNGRPE